MALFKTQKNTPAPATTKPAARVSSVTVAKHSTEVILSPRITEKAAYLAESGAYVFNIARDANKHEVATAVKALFKVTPRKVTIVRTEGKKIVNRATRRVGQKSLQKKAIVFLKKGDTIDIA